MFVPTSHQNNRNIKPRNDLFFCSLTSSVLCCCQVHILIWNLQSCNDFFRILTYFLLSVVPCQFFGTSRSDHCGGITSKTHKDLSLWLIVMIVIVLLRLGMSCIACWMRYAARTLVLSFKIILCLGEAHVWWCIHKIHPEMGPWGTWKSAMICIATFCS